MMAFTGFTFADEVEVPEERPLQEERQKENRQERLTETIRTYAPELLSAYTVLWDQHNAIHVDLEALKENFKADKAAEREAFKAEMKALIEAEEITREEVKVIVEGIKAENQENKALLRAEIEALKDSYGLSKDNHKALFEALKALVEVEDAAGINNQLVLILDYLDNHVAFDIAKYAVLANQ